MPAPSHPPSCFSALVTVIEKCVRGMDQKLGYPGRDRFVAFYYEPRGEEVIWRDSRSYGFANGAWPVFQDELAPVADLYDVHVGGDGSPGTHVLLIDRAAHQAYFVERAEAVQFLAAVATAPGAALAVVGSAVLADPPPAIPASVEVTQETIARRAYEIWETGGRVEGCYMDDWLEAEAQLAAAAAVAD